MWWTRVFRRRARAEAAHAAADGPLQAAAQEFLRRSLNDYHCPDPAAIAKSRALLERALTPEQRGDLFAWGHFHVKGKRHIYRIREGHSGNVDRLDSRARLVGRYCAHPLGHVPVYDVMLAQKLWIETDEDMFLKAALSCPLHA